MEVMRRFLILSAFLAGCVHSGARSIHGPALGRVVVYRNGVAFYERRAVAEDGHVTVRVPRERVDDFLKSLTVVDRDTGEPIPVAIPRRESDDGSGEHNYLTMTLETPGRRRANVMLTYITDAPAWRPSYRIVVGPHGKVMLEGWAIVDNLSGEDWKDVQVGVGASSALSFRYDLWSVHHVDRDLLQGDETFAVAPPTGVSPYAEGPVTAASEELASFGQEDLGTSFSGSSSLENQYYVDGANTTGLTFGAAPTSSTTGAISGAVFDKKTGEALAGVTVVVTSPALQGNQTAISDEHGLYKLGELPPGDYTVMFYYADQTVEQKTKVQVAKVATVTQKIDQTRAGGEVIQISAKVPTIDPTSTTQGFDRMTLQNIPPPGRTFDAALGAAAGSQADSLHAPSGTKSAPPPKPDPDAKLHAIASKVNASKKDVMIEVSGNSRAETEARATKLKDKLVDEGVPVKRIHVTANVAPSNANNTRLLAVAPSSVHEAASAPPSAHTQTSDTPVGESHFIAEQPMTVRAGSSAMVAMVHGQTDGGVVYLYDPISDRGDKKYAFKAIHLINPTHDTLEPGPVTVYGDGKFIGEGITEPVPPNAAVVVPFALDREVVVNPVTTETDRIAKLVTVQRGEITAEVQHRRNTRYTITSRLADKATVYLRHRLETGWQLVTAPSAFLRVGDSQLFQITLEPGSTKYIDIAEAAPVQRTFELSSDDALGMMKVYIDEPDATPELKKQIEALLATHRGEDDIRDKIKTLRDQLGELQMREGELHAQIVTLRAVKTGGELMATLRSKLAETSDRIQKTTIAIVDAQEQLMLQRVKFANQLVDLHLTDATVSKR